MKQKKSRRIIVSRSSRGVFDAIGAWWAIVLFKLFYVRFTSSAIIATHDQKCKCDNPILVAGDRSKNAYPTLPAVVRPSSAWWVCQNVESPLSQETVSFRPFNWGFSCVEDSALFTRRVSSISSRFATTNTCQSVNKTKQQLEILHKIHSGGCGVRVNVRFL